MAFFNQFQEISHAYSVLIDKEKRDRYDKFGDAEDLVNLVVTRAYGC